MLDKIYDFALKNCDILKDSSFQLKKIYFHIILNDNGNCLGILEYKKPEYTPIPAKGNLGGSAANVIIEDIDVMLFNSPTKEDRSNNYYSIVNENSGLCVQFDIIKRFLNKLQNDEDFKNEILEKRNNCETKSGLASFIINGEQIEKSVDVCNSIVSIIKAAKSGAGMIGISSLSGKEKELNQDTVFFKAKGKQYKISLTPAKAKSSHSYFQDSAIMARIGIDEAEIIKNGIETMLNNDKYYDSFFKLCHWYDDELNEQEDNEFGILFGNYREKENEEDAIANRQKVDKENKNLTDVLDGVKKADSANIGNIKDTLYHSLFVDFPSDGRFKLYGYRELNAKDVVKNIRKFKNDATIPTVANNSQTIENLKSYLYSFIPKSITKDWDEYIRNLFGTNIEKLIYSIYDGTQIPNIFVAESLFIAAHFISIDDKKESESDKRYKYYQYLNAIKTISLYIKRKENGMRNNEAYNLGKMFAVYVKIQETATQGHSVVSQFKAAKECPKIVMNNIANLSIAHLKKIEKDKPGLMHHYSNMLNEIALNIGEYPNKLDLNSQADFTLGYYHQNVILNAKKEKGEEKDE